MTKPENTPNEINRHLEIVLLIQDAYVFKFGTVPSDTIATTVYSTWELALEDVPDADLPDIRRKAVKSGRCGTLSDVLEVWGVIVSERNKTAQEARENEIFEAKRIRHLTPELLTERQKQILAEDGRIIP